MLPGPRPVVMYHEIGTATKFALYNLDTSVFAFLGMTPGAPSGGKFCDEGQPFEIKSDACTFREN